VLALSLVDVLQEAAARTKNYTGFVADVDDLLQPANVGVLGSIAPMFALFAVDSRVDTAVDAYLELGTLADDSGPDVLALLLLGRPAPVPVPVDGDSFLFRLRPEQGRHPAHEVVRLLFPDRAAPSLPWLILFNDLIGETSALFVPLDDCADRAGVVARLREVFACASAGARGREAADPRAVDAVALELTRRQIRYVRSGQRSMREWMLAAIRFVRTYRGEIAAAIRMLG
jgi:hypothetical protein